ncbi:magnesium chelatase [Candidatus Magnetomorum sp. HK-1]|nr:magnesium chelatase [Candidatus Magnetomorum sp. HK-1]
MKEWDEQNIDHFYQGLICAKLHKGLRSILLLDADFETIDTIIPLFTEILKIGAQSQLEIVKLPSSPSEDDLWGNIIPKSDSKDRKQGTGNGLSVIWREGLLTWNRIKNNHLLIVIPDLARINLSISRACIMLMDTPVTVMQRHGQEHIWKPNITWLAACDRDKIGRVSEHLLDRFSLRLSPPPFKKEKNISKIIQWLDSTENLFTGSNHLPEDVLYYIKDKLKSAEYHYPVSFSSEAIQRILKYYFPEGSTLGVRRELTLARMSQALARLDLSTGITVKHVIKAAEIIGLPDIPQDFDDSEKEPQTDLEPEKNKEPSRDRENGVREPETAIPEDSASIFDDPPTYDPEPQNSEPEAFPPHPMLDKSPYPEDTAPVEREQFSLRLPIRRHTAVSDDRGIIMGIQSTSTLHDIALVPTIIEAAIFQNIRRKNNETLPKDRLVISPADLRSYLRESKPDRMLILVIDFTCLKDCKWQDKLIHHLRWAYVNRASVCIVQVGADTDENELKAKKVTAKTILSPAINNALESRPGKATPLAHGLDLAYHTIQQSRLHGRGHVTQSRLVVITDGRGNVPLSASQDGKIEDKRPVNREGIDDALEIAHKIFDLKKVLSTILDPQPRYHAELPIMLADAMGAVRELVDLDEDF